MQSTFENIMQLAAPSLTSSSLHPLAVTVYPTTVKALALLAGFCAIFLVLHQLRRRYKGVDTLYLRLLGPLLRPREIRGELPGAYWFLLGAAGAVAIFPKDVALQR